MEFSLRRVVTGHDSTGAPVVTSDGMPPHAIALPDGTAVADVWSLDGPLQSVDDGCEPEGGFSIEPPAGGMWWRFIRLPLPDQSLPKEEQFLQPPGGEPGGPQGMHATATLDFAVILDGQIELESETGGVVLGPGDCVVQRGTQHRWRVVGDGPCRYLVALFGIVPGASEPPEPTLALLPAGSATFGPRRVVVGVGDDGRSRIVADGLAPCVRPFATGGGIVDLWQTGGPLASAQQGGDPPGSWSLEPLGGGIVFRFIELTANPEPGMEPVHSTNTIDLLVVLDGSIELELPGSPPIPLDAGDLVVQRGTAHAWHNRGDGTARMLAIMVAAPPAG